jgi:hypothetical protein
MKHMSQKSKKVFRDKVLINDEQFYPNFVLPNILTFMWESTWDGGQWFVFLGLRNLPKTIGQKHSQIAQSFLSMKIFSEC